MNIQVTNSMNRYQKNTSTANHMKITEKEKQKVDEKLASGKKVNSAADDASAMAISNELVKQIKSLTQGSDNIQYGIDATQIADGAMQSISDNLLDLQTNSIRAMNGTMSTDDKNIIQQQADATLKTVDHITDQTQYNGKNLIDGSTKKIDIYTGTSSEVLSGTNASSEALGLKDYSLTDDNIDTSILDYAAKNVSSSRSTLGSQTNGLNASYNSNQVAIENTNAADSRMTDTEMEEAETESNSKKSMKMMEEYIMKKQMEQKEINNKMLMQ